MHSTAASFQGLAQIFSRDQPPKLKHEVWQGSCVHALSEAVTFISNKTASLLLLSILLLIGMNSRSILLTNFFPLLPVAGEIQLRGHGPF